MSKIALLNITKDLECPPLNLAYLGAYLEKNNKSMVKIIDINFDDIHQELKEFKPDLIGISSFTIKFNTAKKIAKKNNLLKNFRWEKSDPSYIHEPIFLDKSISKKDFLKIFREIKKESQEINPNKQNKVLREIKDVVYYNGFLYKITEKTINSLPEKIREKFIRKLNLKENLI